MNCSAIVTHKRPHLDEIVAIWLLKKFGEESFPGIKNAEINFSGDSSKLLEDISAAEWEKAGMLLVGVGGGRFDEHPANDNNRKEKDCAATLVAKELGIDQDPALEKILKFTTADDLNGSGHPFNLAHIIKSLYNLHSENEVIKWAMMALDAKHQEQIVFWEIAKTEFEQKAQIEEIKKFGLKYRIATVASDCDQINKFARYTTIGTETTGGKIAIIIQKKSSGNVQIFTNRKFGFSLYMVAAQIRLAEQKIQNRPQAKDWREMIGEGKVKNAEEWYYFPKGESLFNGSLTSSNTPPTRLPIEKIQQIVRENLRKGTFFLPLLN